MTKYIFLYNYWGDTQDERDSFRMSKYLIPDMVVKPFQIIGREIEEGQSIWIPEAQYLIAWTIWNHNDLMEYMRTGDDDTYTLAEDGVEWYNMHKHDELYVWFKDDTSNDEDNLKRLYEQYIKAMKLLEVVQDKMTLDEFGEYVDILENNGIQI